MNLSAVVTCGKAENPSSVQRGRYMASNLTIAWKQTAVFCSLLCRSNADTTRTLSTTANPDGTWRALALPPPTSTSGCWGHRSASLFPPITTRWRAESFARFHILSGISLLQFIFSAAAWPSSFLRAALYSNIVPRTTDVKLKLFLNIRRWHLGRNKPSFSVLRWGHLHIIPVPALPWLFTWCHYLYRCSFPEGL